MEAKTKKLRRLLTGDEVLVAPCAYDALSVKSIEAAGFKLAGTTGYGMHGSMLGTPDNGLLAFNEMVAALGKMADSVEIPIMADAEGGYGNAINTMRTVREFEKAGIAGLFIEDQKLPPNCPFIKATENISIEEMTGKIKAAVDARHDENFVIVARTDASFAEAVHRANTYLEAGADMVKVIPKTREELLAYPQQIKGPIHLGLYANKGINDGMTATDAVKLGYKIITYPMSCLFAATAALQSVMRYIKEHDTDEDYPGLTLSFDEYLQFIGADKYKEMDKKYLQG